MPDSDKEPAVEVDAEEQDPVSQVVVDLDKKPAEKQTDPPKPEKPPVDISKLHNTIAYQNRKLEQAMRELQETKAEIQALREKPTVHEPQTQDEIDEIAQKDWKLGVKTLVSKDIEKTVNDILSKRDQIQREIEKKSLLTNELERSKQKVIERYPSIEEEGSEESQIYRQVINEDSSILSNVHGPEIAMYRMEERMRQMGKTPASVQPFVEREVNRLVRAGASSVVGRQANQNGKITLNKEQKEFCDHYKIPYEQYAKNLKAQDARGGVEA